ncbi:MAG: hypothetical protein V7646_2371, partial [Pseudonocardia sp.]
AAIAVAGGAPRVYVVTGVGGPGGLAPIPR